MPFDPNAASKPFISVEGPGKQSPAQSLDRPAAPRPLNDYEEQIISMRREETSLFCAIESLRVEAERLVAWRNSSECESWWGDSQMLHAAQTRAQHCTEAAELKAIAEKKFPGESHRLFDGIFAKPSQFGEAITSRARTELGL